MGGGGRGLKGGTVSFSAFPGPQPAGIECLQEPVLGWALGTWSSCQLEADSREPGDTGKDSAWLPLCPLIGQEVPPGLSRTPALGGVPGEERKRNPAPLDS